MYAAHLNFREANIDDIPQMHIIRLAVKENVLTNPDLVKEKDYEAFLTTKGKGWVCEQDGIILGFAIVDMEKHNVWALFIDPEHEGRGIGKELQKQMLEWYFKNTAEPIWLGTTPGTRAEKFYRLTGWREAGMHGREIKFEMSKEEWGKTCL
jgi:GNAT superfamily N-acetyltransferase